MSKVNPIPEGYHSVTPYLCLSDAAAALDFYQKAFGATELFRMAGPDGKVGHAELKIGNSILMMASEYPEMGFRSPQTLGGCPIALMIYVEDVDAFAEKAVAAGAFHPHQLGGSERLLVEVDGAGRALHDQVGRDGVVSLGDGHAGHA